MGRGNGFLVLLAGLVFGLLLLGAGTASADTPGDDVAPPAGGATGPQPGGGYAHRTDFETPDFHGLTPRLGLAYESSAPDRGAGAGWSVLGGSEIVRRGADHGDPRFDATDVYLFDGRELVACAPGCPSGGTHESIAGEHERVARIGDGWTRTTREGTRMEYRLLPGPGGRPETWGLDSVADLHGNRVAYRYACTGWCHLESVEYAGASTGACRTSAACPEGVRVVLHHEARPDPVRISSRLVVDRRLHTAEVRMDGRLLRAYALTYATGPGSGASVLTSVQQFAADATVGPDGTVTPGPTPPLPPERFTTASLEAPAPTPSAATHPASLVVPPAANTALAAAPPQTVWDTPWPPDRHDDVAPDSVFGDFDGDGRVDVAAWFDLRCESVHVRLAADPAPHTQLVLDKACDRQRMSALYATDLDGDHRDDLLLVDDRGVPRVRLLSAGDGTFREVAAAFAAPAPWLNLLHRCTTGDLDGDDRAEYVCLFTDPAGLPRLAIARTRSDDVTSDVSVAVAPVGPQIGSGPEIAVGDTDADGDGDVVLSWARPGSGEPLTLHVGRVAADGATSWSSTPTPWLTGGAVTILSTPDVDGDGSADVVVQRLTASFGTTDLVWIATSEKLGAVGSSAQLVRAAVPVDPTTWTHLADVDGDRAADVVGVGRALTVRHSSHDGGFAPPVDVRALPSCGTAQQTADTTVADANGDGRDDVVCTRHTGGGSSPGELSVRSDPSPLTATEPFAFSTADVDGDGRDGLVAVAFHNPGYEVMAAVPAADGSVTVTPRPVDFPGGPPPDAPDVRGFLPIDAGSAAGSLDGRTDLVRVDLNPGGGLRTTTLLNDGSRWVGVTAAVPTPAPLRRDVASFRPADVDGDGRTDLVRFTASTSGGVRMEVLRARGDGTFALVTRDSFAAAQAFPAAGADDTEFRHADLNRDGVTDFVHLQLTGTGATTTGYTVRTLLSTGAEQWSERVQPVTAPGLDRSSWRDAEAVDTDGDGLSELARAAVRDGCATLESMRWTTDGWAADPGSVTVTRSDPCAPATGLQDAARLSVADVNGDGRADLVHVSTGIDPAGARTTSVFIAVASADGRLLARPAPTVPAPAVDVWSWRVADLDADNRPELVHLGREVVAVHGNDTPDELVAVDNGVGLTTRVSYRAHPGGPEYLPAGMLTRAVDTVTTSDAAYTPPQVTTSVWGFAAGSWSTEQRRLRGYGEVVATEAGASVRTTHDLTDSCGTRIATQVREADRAVLSTQTWVYPLVAGAGVADCAPSSRTDASCEAVPACRIVVTTYGYDRFGNVETLEERAPELARLTRTVAVVDADVGYIVNRPQLREVSRGSAGGWVPESRTRYGYDGRGVDGGMGARGELTQVVETTDLATGATAETGMGYDDAGNLVTTITGEGVVTTSGYDRLRSLYRETDCTAAGCTATRWDEARLLPRDATDPNGAVTVLEYDAHGRVVVERRPGTGARTTRYLDEGRINGPDDARQRIRTEQEDGIAGDGVLWGEEFRDGHGRLFRTRAEGTDPARPVVADSTYLGDTTDVRTTTAPYVPGDAVHTTVRDYDGDGRPVRVTAPDGTVLSAYRYGAGFSDETDAVGRVTRTDRDEFGRATAVTESPGACVGPGACPPSQPRTTRYDYDAHDRLVQIRDADGGVTTIVRDGLGRERVTTDPDRGRTEKEWNRDGTLHVERDALRVREWAYDTAGRPRERTDSSLSGGGATVRAAWTWDLDPLTARPAGASVGRITRTTSTTTGPGAVAFSRSASYTVAGRQESTHTCVDGVCADLGFEYDPAGRLAAVTYPQAGAAPAERVVNGYDAQGALATVGGYVTASVRDPRGQVTQRTYGNGLVENNAYDDARAWLDTQTVGRPGADPVYRTSYEHDGTGRVSTVRLLDPDPARPDRTTTEDYTYDGLGRLVAIANDHRPDAVRSYTYDPIGRVTGTDRTGTHTYGDPAHARAVTATTAGHRRGYDALGNLERKQDPGSRVTTLTWTLGDTLASERDDRTGRVASFGYDDEGSRVVERDAAGARIHIDRYLEIAPDGGVTRRYWAEDRQVAARHPDGSVEYTVSDQTHSTRLTTDGTGAVRDRPRWSAYGQRLDVVPGATGGGPGWQGHPSAQPGGLTYMQARWYDAELGSFASADTVVPAAERSTSLNRYAYTANDPVNLWDPSGHSDGARDDTKVGLFELSAARWWADRADGSGVDTGPQFDVVTFGEASDGSGSGPVRVDCRSCTLLGEDPPETGVWEKLAQRAYEADEMQQEVEQHQAVLAAQGTGWALGQVAEGYDYFKLEGLGAVPMVGMSAVFIKRGALAGKELSLLAKEASAAQRMMLEVQVFRGSSLVFERTFLSGPGQHAEIAMARFLSRNRILRAGDELIMIGGFDICWYGACRPTLNTIAIQQRVRITYYGFTRELGSRTFFEAGKGHIPMKLLEQQLKVLPPR